MEDIFKTLGNILRPEQTTEINSLNIELLEVKRKIEKLTPRDSYLEAVNRSFPYGVGFGGSGKGSLNKSKERHLDKLLDSSLELNKLYTQQDKIEAKIKDIESGEADRREERKKTRTEKLADYWTNLKEGDELNIGNTNGNPIVLKKSKKSVLTTSGTKWTVAEVIGKEAAKLIN